MRSMGKLLILALFELLALVQALQNITVDDTSSDIIYSPRGAWRQGQNCVDNCQANPQPQLAYQQTWHESFHSESSSNETATAEFLFTGSAIYCYGIQGDNSGLSSHLTFLIDDQEVKHYDYTAPGGRDFTPNHLLFGTSNLGEGNHKFTLVNPGGVSGTDAESIVLLDYFVYSREESGTAGTEPPSSTVSSASKGSSNNHAGAIAGGVVGGLVFLLLVAFGIFAWFRHKQNKTLLPFSTAKASDWSDKSPHTKAIDLNPTAWLSANGGSQPRSTPAPAPAPLAFDPEMMVARSTPPSSPPPRVIDLTSGEPNHRSAPPPPRSMHPTQSRILAWQRQTAEATAADKTPREVPQSEALSSYWDHSTKSYRSWEARQQSPPVPEAYTGGFPQDKSKSLPPPTVREPSRPLPRPLPIPVPPIAAPSPIAPQPSLPLVASSISSEAPAASPPLPSPPPIPAEAAATPRSPRRVTRRLTVMNN